MALEIRKEDLVKTGTVQTKNNDSLGGVISGLDSTIGKVITGINALGNTAEQFGNLFDKFSDLRGKLPGQQQQISKEPSGPIRQPQPAYAERAERPTTPQTTTEQTITEEKPMIEDKTEKAKKIFDELHELIKPYIPFAGTITAAQLIKMAMQPANKEMIINEIAKRL
jgi:hypothetical protein